MPKDFVGVRARVVQEEKRMCAVVAGSSRPERALKNEVFRLCETMAPKEMGAVLGNVYVRLGAHERTASMAEYMKDLYGSGSRRLFAPKPIVGAKLKLKVEPVKVRESVKLALTVGTVENVPSVGVGRFTASAFGKLGGRSRVNKAVERAKVMAKARAAQSSKAAASADTGSVAPSGADPDNVVSLQSVANYCLHTAKLYMEVKPVYDMLLELYSRNPTKEWLALKEKIKAHMDTLPKGGYTMIVTGDHVEHKQVANNVEKVEANGVGIVQKTAPAAPKKDGRTRTTPTGKKVRAVYLYNHFREPDAHQRLDWFYRALIKYEWMDKETNHEVFKSLFEGKPKEFTIKWITTQADLYALIKNLFSKGLISATKGGGKWEIVESHFVDRNSRVYTNMNKQKESKRSESLVSFFVNLLNPSVPVKEEQLKELGLI